MLAGIEFGLLHLFPHRINAFKDMVYFSNGETLFSETFIRFLSVPQTCLSKQIGLSMGLGGETTWGPPFSETKDCGHFPAKGSLAATSCSVSLSCVRLPGGEPQVESVERELRSTFRSSDPRDCGAVATHWSETFWKQRPWAVALASL